MSMDFIDALVADHATVRELSSLAGRQVGLELGRVVERIDPEGMGRVKATTAAKGGSTPSDWLYRLTLPGLSYPVPGIGQTVAIAYEGGDPHKGYYWPLQNLPNPAYTPDALRFKLGPTEVLIEQDGSVSITGFDSLSIAGASVSIDASVVAIDAGAIALKGLTSIDGKEALVTGSVDNGGFTNLVSGQ